MIPLGKYVRMALLLGSMDGLTDVGYFRMCHQVACRAYDDALDHNSSHDANVTQQRLLHALTTAVHSAV